MINPRPIQSDRRNSNRESLVTRASELSLLVPHKSGSRSPNNFDLMRLGMAMLVVWSHSFALYFGSENREPISLLTKGAINSGKVGVYVFFIISGFLITQSYERSASALSYLRKRICRIYPGFIVATIICAFVIVPLYSKDFNFSPGLIAKTLGLNLLLRGYIEDHGAFGHNAVQAVDGSLWSIPYEFWCYLGVLALGLSQSLKAYRGKLLLAVFLLLLVVRAWLELIDKKPGFSIIDAIFGWPYEWLRVLPCFLSGMLAYFYREFLPRRLWIAILGPLTLVSALNLPVSFPCRMALLSLLFPPIATYCVFYFVYSKRSFNAARFGDFSYGTYLYAFPIQQMMLASLGAAVPFWLYVPLAMIMSLIAGILSWHGIERWFNQSRATAAPRRAPTAFSTPESNANSSHS